MAKGDGFKPKHKGGNKWLVTIACGYNAMGKPIRKSEIFLASPKKSPEAQLKEACRYRDKLRAQYEEGKISAVKEITLKDYSEEWMNSYCVRKGLKPSTMGNYRNLLDTRIVPKLGKLKLKEITPAELNKFFNNLRKDGISGTYQKSYYTLLHTMLKSAMREQRIMYNPTERIESPKKDTKESVHFTAEEARHFVEVVCSEAPAKWRAYALLAVSTGVRKGEMLGLNWSDINFADGTVSITRSVGYAKGVGQYVSTPKTAQSIREVPLGKNVAIVLMEWKREQNEMRLKLGEAWEGVVDHADAVFTQDAGKRMHKDSPGNWFKRFKKKYALPSIKLHGLRHTAATLMLEQGINVVDLSRVLGHSRVETTYNIYLHQNKNAQREAAEKMDAVLFGNIG